MDLYFDEQTPNFCNLVKTLEIDIPPGAVREVLKKFQIVIKKYGMDLVMI